MWIEEFNARRVRTEDSQSIYLDVRPFQNRQGEAIETYLRSSAGVLRTQVQKRGLKRTILLCDVGTVIPASVYYWMRQFKASGVKVEIRTLPRKLSHSPDKGPPS
jgi:hypothetical protein